jgi:hypothetical protein
MENNINTQTNKPSPTATSNPVIFAPSSRTPFASAPNKAHWDGVMGASLLHPTEEFHALYLEMANAIKRAAPAIIALKGGTKLHSAFSVLDELSKPQYRVNSSSLDDMFVDDCLGIRGLSVPNVNVGGRTYYALHLIEATEIEQDLFQSQLDQLTDTERNRLLVA